MLPNTDANAKLVLEIYAHFNRQADGVLGANNFVAVAARRRIRMSDLQNGLNDAVSKAWIEETENGFLRLTDLGFKEMQQLGHSH